LPTPYEESTLTVLAAIVLVPKDKLVIRGDVKRWAGRGSSGKVVWRIFCPQCGSPIAHEPESNPVASCLKAGTLDTEIKKSLKPVGIEQIF
jgi:hypothetical protein